MIKAIKRRFRDSPFRTKIIAISLLSGLLPLLLLTVTASFILNRNLTTEEENKNDEYLSAASLQLNNKLTTFNDALTYLMNNRQLTDGLPLETISNFNLYDYYANDIVPMFNSVSDQHPDIRQITLYTNQNIYNHGAYVKKIQPEDLTEHFAVNRSIKPQYYYDGNNGLYAYLQLFNNNQDLNFLVFELDYESLFADLPALSQGRFKVDISTQQQETVFSFSSLKHRSPYPVIGDLMDRMNLGSVSGKTELINGWQLTFAKPKQDIFAVTVLVFIAALVMFLIMIILIFLSTRALSKTVVDPIATLAEEMSSITDSRLDLTYKYTAKDEIGQLYQSFEDMLREIRRLIDEVYNAEIKQQKLEMQALQAQINPHFFYNSLSLINNKAILIKNREISEMAQLLSSYYRLSLNQGKNIISVEKELELTITYAKLQQRMHSFSFDLELTIDPSVATAEMINLLLQPFVENAIFHGIDHIEDDRQGVVAIRARRLDEQLIFEIFDNGAGMLPEKAAKIFTSPGKHYGVQNVMKRIQLYYQNQGHLYLYSYPNEGTFVQLILPVKRPQTS